MYVSLCIDISSTLLCNTIKHTGCGTQSQTDTYAEKYAIKFPVTATLDI